MICKEIWRAYIRPGNPTMNTYKRIRKLTIDVYKTSDPERMEARYEVHVAEPEPSGRH